MGCSEHGDECWSFIEIGGCHKLHRMDCIAWNYIVDILMTCEVPSPNVVPGGGWYSCLKIQGPYDFFKFFMLFLSLLVLMLGTAFRFSLKCELLI